MRPLTHLFLALALVLPWGALVACGGPQVRPEGLFEEHVRTFHTHMRWGRWESAASFLPDEDRFGFLGEYDERGDDYEVVEYEITSINLNSDRVSGVVSVRVQSFRLPSTRVHNQRFVERWEWNEHRRLWELAERRERDENGDRPRREREEPDTDETDRSPLDSDGYFER